MTKMILRMYWYQFSKVAGRQNQIRKFKSLVLATFILSTQRLYFLSLVAVI